MMKELQGWKDIEFQISNIQKGRIDLPREIKIANIFNCLASEIEKSLIPNEKVNVGLIRKFIQKYRFQELVKKKQWNPKWKYPLCNEDLPETPENLQESILRLKTAITAFKLHNSTFSSHPLFGELNKKDWEYVHLTLANFLFSKILQQNTGNSPRRQDRKNLSKFSGSRQRDYRK